MRKLFAALVMVFTLVACNKGETVSKSETTNDNPYAKLKIALVSDTIERAVYSQAYNALMSATDKYGFEAISIECADTAAWSRKREAACVEGCDLICVGGFRRNLYPLLPTNSLTSSW